MNEPMEISNAAAAILNWFHKAMPTPTTLNQRVQLGCHFEEVGEMCEALGAPENDAMLMELKLMAHGLKTGQCVVPAVLDRKEFLDSLCDQIVTALGVGYTQGFDMLGALDEVNRSNWSKFVNGEPQWDANGKIAKSASFTKPDLSRFLG